MGGLKRSVWFWLSLVVIFVVCYQAFSRPNARVESIPVHWWGVGLVALFFLLFAIFFTIYLRLVKVITAAARDINEGRAFAALTTLDAYQHKENGLIDHHRGLALSALWRLDDAVLMFETALARRWASRLRPNVEPHLRLARALRGDPLSSDLNTDPTSRLADAIFRLRNQEQADALQLLSLENMRALGGRNRALADALRAWTLVRSGAAMPPVDLVGVLGETGVDSVRKYWPEFADFLEHAAKHH